MSCPGDVVMARREKQCTLVFWYPFGCACIRQQFCYVRAARSEYIILQTNEWLFTDQLLKLIHDYEWVYELQRRNIPIAVVYIVFVIQYVLPQNVETQMQQRIAISISEWIEYGIICNKGIYAMLILIMAHSNVYFKVIAV